MAWIREVRGLLCLAPLALAGCIFGAQLPEEIDTDDPTTGAGTGEPSTLVMVTGGNKYGECQGNCRFEISFQPTVVQLVVSDYGAVNEVGVNFGLLTEQGQAELTAIDEGLSDAALLDIYGCPDCDDSGASWVRLNRGFGVSDHEYEAGNPPAELADYDLFLQTMIVALQLCAENELVTIDEDCTPI